MKIGLSIYSLLNAIRAGEMSIPAAIRWIADNGGEHVEIVDFVWQTGVTPEAVAEEAAGCGLSVSAYCIFANVLEGGRADFEAELQRVHGEIDVARRLGAAVLRSDLAQWGRPAELNVIERFEADLPRLVEACRIFADYAGERGVTVTVENHGAYVNGGDRVRRLITAVDRKNFLCTLDVGNALCVDVDPIVCVKTLLPFAAAIHFKDFYVRRGPAAPGGDGWLTTGLGTRLRGAIVGQGDVDVRGIMQAVRESGYDGPVAVEFEGLEDCRLGSRLGMDMVRQLANE